MTQIPLPFCPLPRESAPLSSAWALHGSWTRNERHSAEYYLRQRLESAPGEWWEIVSEDTAVSGRVFTVTLDGQLVIQRAPLCDALYVVEKGPLRGVRPLP